MTFLIKRGRAALARKSRAHLARIDALGNISGAWCREQVDGNWLSSNVPWGLRTCKHCIAAIDRYRKSSSSGSDS